MGCISKGDEYAYQDRVERLSVWCIDNNMVLKNTKTKKLIIDYKKNKTVIQYSLISVDCVERVSDLQFLGVHIEEDLTWNANTTAL